MIYNYLQSYAFTVVYINIYNKSINRGKKYWANYLSRVSTSTSDTQLLFNTCYRHSMRHLFTYFGMVHICYKLRFSYVISHGEIPDTVAMMFV